MGGRAPAEGPIQAARSRSELAPGKWRIGAFEIRLYCLVESFGVYAGVGIEADNDIA